MKSSANGTYTVQTSGRQNFFVILLGIMTIIGGLFYSATDASAADTLSLIVKMESGLTVDEQTAVIARNGGVETSSVPALRLHIVTVSTADQPLVQQNYQADAQVVSVEVNKTRKAEAIPTDANYGVQWALSKIGWESIFGAVAPTGMAKLALLDTGVDATHPDLAGVVIPGTSILDGSNGLGDPSGHGTWLAGIAAAATDNGAGIAGIAFGGVQIMPVNVLNAGGTGQDSDIIAGIVWAVDHGADVILMGFSNPDFSQNLQDAIDYAWSKGVVLVAATGNDGVTTPTFPAGDRGVIGVSATDPNDLLAPASNYGQDTFLAAPGTDIYTTGPNGGYSYISGTSASSAFVAGAAAFMKAADPLLTNGIIVGRLARAADAIGTAGDPNNQAMFGNGRLNMAKALTDTGLDSVQPAGAPGGGGPFVGPYAAAAPPQATVTVTAAPTGAIGGTFSITRTQNNGNQQTSGGTTTQPYAVQPSSSFSITGIQATVNGYNYVGPATVAGTAGAANTTTTVTLNYQLACTVPTITTLPSSHTVVFGNNASFSSAASSPSTVQWQVSTDGGTTYSDISGATSGTLTITSPTVALSGNKYRAVFSNCSPALTVTSNAATLTVNPASSTVTVTCPASVTYNGSAQTPCTAKATGVGMSDLDVTASLVYGNNTNAGTATAAASWAGDANHSGNIGSGSFEIAKAPVTATAGSYSGQYDGSAHSPTACAVTGAYKGDLSCANDPASVGAGVSSGEVNPAVSGTGLDNFAITPVKGSYSITQAPSTVTVTCPASVTYNGSAQTPCTAKATGVGMSDLDVTASLVYGNNTNAGTATAVASWAGDANHTGNTGSGSFEIAKAPVTATAGSYSGQYDGSAHSPTACAVTGAYKGDLSCANDPASVGAGVSSGEVNPAVSGTGLDNFAITPVKGSYSITQAPSTVTVTCPASVTYNGSAQTPCTAKATGVGMSDLDVTASLVYGNNTNAGTATAAASWAGDANHTGNIGSGSFEIAKAPVTATAGSGSGTYSGSSQSPGACVVTGVYTGSLSCTNNPASVGPAASTYSISPVMAGNTTNFVVTSVNGSYTINKANATCTVTGYSVIYDGNPHTAAGSCIGVNGEGLSGLNISSSTHTNVGSYTDSWTFINANYNDKNDAVTDIIQAWTLKGFYQPVDMNGVWNTVKNSSTVPLKFEIFSGNIELTDVSKIKSVNSVQVTCANDAMENAIEEVLTTTGGTALRYDSTGGQFVDNWKTPNKAGNCYRVTMTTLDGSSLMALFKLK